MKSKVFVTGASGTLGKHIVKQLAEKNYKVTAAVRDLNKAKFPASVESVKFDYTDSATYSNVKDSAAVFLIAPPLDFEASTKMAPFIEYLKKNTKATIILNTVIGAELDENSPLGKVEKLVKDSGLNYYIARPNFFMDNFISMMGNDVKNGSYALPTEDKKTNFISGKNIAEVEIALFEKNDPSLRSVTLCGKEALSYFDTAKTLSLVLGKEVKYIPIAETDMVNGLTQAGLPKSVIEYIAGLYQAVRAGYCENYSDDYKKVMGKEPNTFKEFVEENKNAWM